MREREKSNVLPFVERKRDAWSSVQCALTRQHRTRIIRIVPWMEKGILRVRCFDIISIEGVLTRYYGTRTANVIVWLESDERGMLGAQDVPPVAPIYRVLAKCPVTSLREGMEMLGTRCFAFIHGVLTLFSGMTAGFTVTCLKERPHREYRM